MKARRMAKAQTTIIELGRMSLSHGEAARLHLDVPLDPLDLGGQTYVPAPASPEAVLDVSRLSHGFAFRLRFTLAVKGPCVRCLDAANVEVAVDAREVDQQGTDDEDLHSPYVDHGELRVGRWAQDAAILALPDQVLCRSDCLGLCPVCGETLNDADPAVHEHGAGGDPRWAKLRDLELE
jgi:uncharacterized protein